MSGTKGMLHYSLETKREAVQLILEGRKTYAQVAETLHLSEATVRYHMGQMLERLHLENRTQIIAYAAHHGLARSRTE